MTIWEEKTRAIYFSGLEPLVSLSLSLSFQVFFLFLLTRQCGAREENVQFSRRKMCAHLRQQAKEQGGVGKSVKEHKKTQQKT
jgi:hypothetical protein